MREGACSFDRGAVCAAVRAFLHCPGNTGRSYLMLRPRMGMSHWPYSTAKLDKETLLGLFLLQTQSNAMVALIVVHSFQCCDHEWPQIKLSHEPLFCFVKQGSCCMQCPKSFTFGEVGGTCPLLCMLLLQAGHMLGILLPTRHCQAKQAKPVISSAAAAAVAAKSSFDVRCMPVNWDRVLLSQALLLPRSKAGIQDPGACSSSWPDSCHNGVMTGDIFQCIGDSKLFSAVVG